MEILNRCRNILIKQEDIVFAYIFGSYVKDKMKKESDVDIAIYLRKDLDKELYLKIKMDLSDSLSREVDLVILNNAPPLLKYEIYKNNILLFTKDKTLESNYKVNTLFEYTDMKKYLDLSYDKMIQRLKEEVELDGST